MRIRSYGASVYRTSVQSISTAFLFTSFIFAPRCSRIVMSISASLIWGIFSRRQVPLTIRAAGIIATAAFFAPLTSTSPYKGLPPLITYLSK